MSIRQFTITVKPKSRVEKVEKTDRGYIVYVKEPPVENKANKGVIRVLSEYLDIPKSLITIVSGMKSKQKIVEVNE